MCETCTQGQCAHVTRSFWEKDQPDSHAAIEADASATFELKARSRPAKARVALLPFASLASLGVDLRPRPHEATGRAAHDNGDAPVSKKSTQNSARSHKRGLLLTENFPSLTY